MSEIEIGEADFAFEAPEITTNFDFEPTGFENVGVDFEALDIFESETDVFEPREVELFPDEEYVITPEEDSDFSLESEDIVIENNNEVSAQDEHVHDAKSEDVLVSEGPFATEQQLEAVRREISDLVASERDNLTNVERAAVMMLAASLLAEKAKKKKQEEEENKGLLVTLIKMLGAFMQGLADPESMAPEDLRKKQKSSKTQR